MRLSYDLHPYEMFDNTIYVLSNFFILALKKQQEKFEKEKLQTEERLDDRQTELSKEL